MSLLTGADVVDFRKRRNLSRKQLAEEVGLTETKVWRIETKGTIHPDEEARLMLLGVGSNTVTGVEPVPPPAPTPPTVVFSEPVPIQRVVTDAPDVNIGELFRQHQTRHTFERYVSNSELQTFKRCRRKWWLAWFRGLQEKAEAPVGARQVGNRIHRALQTYYVPDGKFQPSALMDELERLIVIDRTLALSNVMNPETAKQFESEADLERIMLEGYLEWLTETGADSDLKVIAPEAYLEVGLEAFGNAVAIIGKIDVRVRRTTDDAVLFLDHKAVAEFTTTTKLLNIMEQMIHYQLLETLSANEGDHVAGALYNMLRRVKRTGQAKPPFYQRVEVRHNPIVLQNFSDRLQGEIIEMLSIEDRLRNGVNHQEVAYPSPTRDCSWDCPFLQVCPMFDDGSRAEDMLVEHFTQHDPLSYYMTEVLGENE